MSYKLQSQLKEFVKKEGKHELLNEVKLVSVSFYSIISCVVDKLFNLEDDYEIPKEELLETLELNRATGYEFINRSIGKILQENLPSIKDLKILPNMPQSGLLIRGAGNSFITQKDVASSKYNSPSVS